ncbi:hypothetical protein NK718_10615 [Alsobacter sp. SYSU M60028]|uniref:Uncharacterized protein n=1 Tax=Alsobacter ponti TaxID=2962936 RepID=A0ABT1LBU4_9HYPH|nr:hypothetical protein [Alsobacter ponti]MCP8938969.1 hypothetical protein [Alsobacter ponti]
MTTLTYSATSVASASDAGSLLSRLAARFSAVLRAIDDSIVDRRIARCLARNGGVMTDDIERQLGWIADGIAPEQTRALDAAAIGVLMLRG